MLRLLMIIIGLGLGVSGGWVAAVGVIHDAPNYAQKTRYLQPLTGYKLPLPDVADMLVASLKPLMSEVPKEYRVYIKFPKKGLLYPLGGGGGLIAFAGLIFILNGVFRRSSGGAFGKSQKENAASTVAAAIKTKTEKSRISEDMLPAQSIATASKALKTEDKTVSIDEGIMDEEEDETEKMRDINYLVTISQGSIDAEKVLLVVRMFRPDLDSFIPLFNESGAERLAHQILRSVMFRHRRRNAEITADQFQAQDVRIIECEREVFCHRYMPPQAKITNDDVRDSVGKVYDAYTRSEIQKRFAGEADEWMDVSLRNAAEVLAVKSALDDMPEQAA